jgi:hypothetical protein
LIPEKVPETALLEFIPAYSMAVSGDVGADVRAAK